MKQRILLIVAMLLIATPAFATVTINVVQGTGSDVEKVFVGYTTTGEAVRAFALDFTIEVNSPQAVWAGIQDFNKGESNKPGGGYGIFPGQFRNNINPADPNWNHQYYYPIAPPNDVDSNGTGIGTRKVICELGTLYKDANAPGTAGRLFTLIVDFNGLTTAQALTVATNTVRGGVVLENGTSITPVINAPPTIKDAPSTCTVPNVVNFKLADANAAIIAANFTVGTITYEVNLVIPDGNVIRTLPVGGTVTTCATPVNIVVSRPCLYLGRVFSGTGITTLTVTQAMIDRWVTLGKPNCWCCNAQKRGNGVYTPTSTATKTDALDLAKVKNTAQWLQSLGAPGYNANPCCDTNLSGKIDAVDLARIKNTANWLQTVGAGSGCL